jgi:hypothetical protein
MPATTLRDTHCPRHMNIMCFMETNEVWWVTKQIHLRFCEEREVFTKYMEGFGRETCKVGVWWSECVSEMYAKYCKIRLNL